MDFLSTPAEFDLFRSTSQILESNNKQGVQPTTVADSQFIESRKLVPSDGALGDDFGHYLAMDGNYLVVAASSKQIGTHQGQGAVYVFVRDGTSWVEQQRLTDSDGHGFGSSVAIDGDTIVVGSPFTDGAVQEQGAAYVYVRNGTSWFLQEKLMASNATLWDFMGSSVDIDGNTIVAGAPSPFGSNATSPGSAYVFTREGSNWTQRRKLTASDGVLMDVFGADVAIDNGTIVVGSPHDDFVHNGVSRSDIGSAYIFSGSGSNWTERQKLTGLDSVSNDNVGWSVAIDGNKLVISAFGDDFPLKSNQGSAYVFNKTAAGWVQQEKLFASDGQEDDHFGVVAIKGGMVAVGVERDDVGSRQDQGSAYIFDNFGSTWTQRQKLITSDGATNEFFPRLFGADVALGNTVLVVGARRTHPIATNWDGAAYVFTNNESCSYSVSPSSITLSATSGEGSFVVNVSNFCQWTATTNADWLLINEPADGSGSGVVSLTVSANNTGSSRSATVFLEDQVVSITQSANNQPLVTDVIRTYSGFFLDGFDHSNNFDVRVDWRGTPGRVRFQVNNNAPFEVQGNADGAVYPFNLETSFPASLSPSTIKITPINGEIVVGLERIEEIYIFPYPTWLQFAVALDNSALTFSTQPGEVRANFNIAYPHEPYRALIPIPNNIPFIGGQFGVRETQGRFSGFASSTGSGNLTLTGNTGFVGMNQQLDGSLSGSGHFLLNQNGLSIPSASFNLGLSGTLKREVRLIDAIPFLSRFDRFPAVRRFTEAAKLRGELKPSFDIGLNWKQDPVTRDLVFNEGTGQVGLEMKGVLSAKITDRIRFEGWVAGGGSVTVGAPAPFARSLDFNFESGLQLNIDNLFGGTQFSASLAYQCTWTPANGEASCFGTESSSDFSPRGSSPSSRLQLIRPRYGKFGDYEAFKFAGKESTEHLRKDASPLASAVEGTIVSNVFGGAEPTILPVGSNGKMLLWVRQNTNLPVLQSTEIAWSYYDGIAWSAPAVIVSDSCAEFSPVAGVDANGKVVAAWLKIKSPSFATPIPTLDDLPLYYKEVEVVGAAFDPNTHTWNAETSLTDDLALDTSLRLARDNSGHLLLTWQSNPDGEFTAGTANPAVLKYSFWNGSSWNAPATVAGNLSDIGEHAVAINGDKAFVVLSHDPNVDAINDSELFVYGWNGTAWSQATVFAAGDVDNQVPTAIYDTTGEGRVIWLQGADLVQAKLSNHTPQIVRQGSESTAFHSLHLLNNARDNLTLIWQEVVDNSPANIFSRTYNPTANIWGEDRRLNQDVRLSKNADGYYDNNGNLQLVYLATEILRVTKTVTINGQDYQIPNIPENGPSDLCVLTVNLSPTATGSSISGHILSDDSRPVAGAVVRLNGTQNRKTITDANGNYSFENVETGGFYSVTPSLIGYRFNPEARSFSQLGNNTSAVFAATRDAVAAGNVIDTAEFFVRQHYLDFLGREPDESGFNFWSDQILSCGSDAACIERRAINVSAAYFLSIEFQQTGGLVDGLYRASYDRRPLFDEFTADKALVGQGVVIGSPNWTQRLAANKRGFVEAWVQRVAFQSIYGTLSNEGYVDALISHTGVQFSASEQSALVNGLNNGTSTRAEVLQQVVENDAFVTAKRDAAFVMMQYFGYLRRDPEESGYVFWLNKLREFNGDFERAEMVKAFLVSGEYRQRFR